MNGVISILIFLSFILSNSSLFAFGRNDLPEYLKGIQEGDLIFYQGSSNQVPAILEASGSKWSHVGIIFKDSKENWVVWEAIQPVGINSLKEFVSRAKLDDKGQRIVATYRLDLDSVKMSSGDYKNCLIKVKKRLTPHLGKDYNLKFTWQTNTLYCSQFVWEGFQACGISVGSIENTTDLQVGDKVLSLFKARVDEKTAGGKKADKKQLLQAFKRAYKGQKIVTPVSVLKDKKLHCISGCGFGS